MNGAIECRETQEESLRTVERRASVRFACPGDAFYYSLARGRDVCVDAEVQNISTGGIGLLFSQEVDPGTILNVEFHSRSRELPCFLLAQVVHACEKLDGRWFAGCRFARSLSELELQMLF